MYRSCSTGCSAQRRPSAGGPPLRTAACSAGCVGGCVHLHWEAALKLAAQLNSWPWAMPWSALCTSLGAHRGPRLGPKSGPRPPWPPLGSMPWMVSSADHGQLLHTLPYACGCRRWPWHGPHLGPQVNSGQLLNPQVDCWPWPVLEPRIQKQAMANFRIHR